MMITNALIKFDKVELLIKNVVNDVVMPSTTKIEFNFCGVTITGEHLIISIEEKDERKIEAYMTVTNRIYNLSDIVAYKTYSSILKM